MPDSDTIIVGLSGGVDSSVAALRLIEAGKRVEGLFMFNWAEDETGYCTAAEDFQSARQVAEALGIPLHQADFSAAYREQVFSHFLSELEAGRTPNPDMLCNRHIKFDAFLHHARRLGASGIATGHYARTTKGRLYRGVDPGKDQSYFLALIHAASLQYCHFPVGDLPKPQVRQLAETAGLPTFDRPDSTGICFIGERPFRDFIQEHLADDSPAQKHGNIIELDSGRQVGQHSGLGGYTLGQRRGLGIGGQRGAAEAPWYVVEKDSAQCQLLVSQNPQHPRLMSTACTLQDMNWIRLPDPAATLTVQYRHRQRSVACSIQHAESSVALRFERAQAAVTPGQYAAIYDNDECLGAGVIASRATLA